MSKTASSEVSTAAPAAGSASWTSETFRQDLRGFLRTRLPEFDEDDSTDIFARGLVNSLFAMELVLFVEKTIGTAVPNEELALDHFRSIENMTALAGRLSASEG